MENHHNWTNVSRKKFDGLLLAILDSLAFSPWPPVKSPFWRVWRRRDTLERRLQHNLSHENCLLFANVLICRRPHNRWLVQPTVIEYIKFIETIECLFTWVVNFTNSDYFDQTPELYYFDFNCKYSCKGFMYKKYFSF